MDPKTVQKILDIQACAKQDPHTQPLLAEYEEAGANLMELLPGMSDFQRSAVMDYIGVFGALHLRLLELALTDKPPETEK